MKRATITIPDGLEQAIERYRLSMEVPPALASIVQTALRTYLEERGYLVEETDGEEDFIPSEGGKPKGLKNAPKLKREPTMADTVIEDRR